PKRALRVPPEDDMERSIKRKPKKKQVARHRDERGRFAKKPKDSSKQ
uniref:ATP-dependent RNA helicase SrmB n=1 Tax=Steinernema glaseri TaxID=37863 RepID=A0A1I7YYR1_9BILA